LFNLLISWNCWPSLFKLSFHNYIQMYTLTDSSSVTHGWFRYVPLSDGERVTYRNQRWVTDDVTDCTSSGLILRLCTLENLHLVVRMINSFLINLGFYKLYCKSLRCVSPSVNYLLYVLLGIRLMLKYILVVVESGNYLNIIQLLISL
jgi:hypothetical protein